MTTISALSAVTAEIARIYALIPEGYEKPTWHTPLGEDFVTVCGRWRIEVGDVYPLHVFRGGYLIHDSYDAGQAVGIVLRDRWASLLSFLAPF